MDSRLCGISPRTDRHAGSGNFGPSGGASPGRPTPRSACTLEERATGGPLESCEARTAVGPTGLEGATGRGSPTAERSGVPLDIRCEVGQARSNTAAPTLPLDAH